MRLRVCKYGKVSRELLWIAHKIKINKNELERKYTGK